MAICPSGDGGACGQAGCRPPPASHARAASIPRAFRTRFALVVVWPEDEQAGERAAKPGARPVAAGERVAVFPAGGRHVVFPNVETAPGFYVRGSTFTLAELFGESDAAGEPSVRPRWRRSSPDESQGVELLSLRPAAVRQTHLPQDL